MVECYEFVDFGGRFNLYFNNNIMDMFLVVFENCLRGKYICMVWYLILEIILCKFN